MTGVLAGALEARHIPIQPDKLSCEVEGLIEKTEGKNLLTAIHVHYRLKVPKGKRVEAIRALKAHESHCPASQSVRRGMQIDWDWQLDEE